MPTIRCTAKLLRELDISQYVDSISPIGDWYANIFTIERQKCLAVINENTLFTCLALAVTKRDYRDLVRFFRNLLANTLGDEGFPQTPIEYVLDLHADLTIGKTQNRSAVASLNNRIADTKHYIQYEGGLALCRQSAVVHMLNETPMSPIGYSNGLEQMQSLLADGAD